MRSSYLHYQITEKLGEGGMGVVYHAHDTKLKRDVALKFLPRHISGNSVERQRFEQEAQSAAVLNHPNITQIYAIEESDDELFIVMEYVRGKELKEAIDDRKLSIAEKCNIALHIASALQVAHEKGVIHRDIKSRNIMLDHNGQAKIMDFGLAYLQGTDHITKTGTTLGTTAYMAPEQLRGEELDERSDIWAYGVVLYELFTATLPFQGMYEPAVMYAIMEEEPQPVLDYDEDIPAYISEVIQQCMIKDRGLRYQTMEAVVVDLMQELKDESPSSRPVAAKPSGMRTSQLLKVGGIPALLVLISVIVILRFNGGETENNTPQKRYMAVLPIENIGKNPSMQAICEGLAETFSFKLSELEQYEEAYWVAPASEMRQMQVKSASQAHKLFGVNLAIISSIQTVQDSTRLILELVDAGKVHRLATKQIVVPGNNMALLEQKGIQAIMEMLDIEMSPDINETLSGASPTNAGAYTFYLRGRAALQDYNTFDSLEEAIKNFTKALAIDSNFPLAYAGLGESYWREYELRREKVLVQKAEEALEKADKLNAQLAPVQYLFGLLRGGTGRYEEAIQHFKQVLTIDPNYIPAYRELAGIYEQQGKVEEAVATFEYAIALKPEVWIGYNDLGNLYLRKGDFTAAAKQFKKIISLTPYNSAAYSSLGNSYYYQGEYEKARDAYQMSLAGDNDPSVASNLATIYYILKEYEKAAQMYQLALQGSPNQYITWANLASVYNLMGKPEEANETYLVAIEKAHDQLEINPNDAELMADLGAYYSDTGDSINARKFIENALVRNDANIIIRNRAVSIYEKLGMRKQALQWITEPMIADIESQPELKELVQDVRFQTLKRALQSNPQQ